MVRNVRVGIAEDYQLVLDALCKLLQTECQIVGTAANGHAAVALANEQKPDIMLIDFSMAGQSGVEAARQIKQANPTVKIIFVTSHTHDAYAREAFNSGASGYVLKQSPATELIEAIDVVAQGNFFVSPTLAEQLQVPKNGADVGTLKKNQTLTSRQREVLQLIAEGRSRKEIASDLRVSMKTIEFHKNQLKRALSVRTTAGLIRYALDGGFVRK